MSSQPNVALVTGASGGIGRETALVLAKNGWHLLLASRNQDGLTSTAEQIRGFGGTADVHSLDVSNQDQIDELAEELRAKGLSPQALVNNSGVAGPSKPLWEVDPEEWDETQAVNVRGVYLCCRAFLPDMIESGSGAIVNVGSVTGKNPLMHRSPYAASKAALIGLTKTLAADAGPLGIRVNLVSPGAVGGERLDWVVESRAKATGQSVDDLRATLTKDSALNRFTEASEVAETVRFLVSDASSGITGVDLTVSAGFVMN